MGHGFFRFALIRCTHVKDVFAHWLMQHHGPGRGADQSDPVLFEKRHDRLRMGRAACQEHGQHVPVFNQNAGVFGSDFGIEFVIQRYQLDLLAVDAAPGIDGVQVEFCTVGGLLDASPDRPREAGCLPDQDLCKAGLAKRSECGERRNACPS